MTDDEVHEEKLREALLRTYFRNRPAGFPASPADRRDLQEHLVQRFRESEEVVLPWVTSRVDLTDAVVLEIGCGTGSSTAAFARRSGYVHGFDIVERCVEAANERLRILGLPNARCHLSDPASLPGRIRKDYAHGVDLVLLYAVMEHQTVEERLETLETCWGVLRPGGHLVVTDSPNRLCYKHYHTSEVPFFDMLPERLAWRVIEESPREEFRTTMQASLRRSVDEAREKLARWGTGISHHEFEEVLGPLDDLIVGDGFDPPIASHKPLVLEEELLLTYLVMTDSPVPLGFARVSVDVILRKPDGGPGPDFRSAGAVHAERVRRRMTRSPGAESARHPLPVASSQDVPPGESSEIEAARISSRVDLEWAKRVAEDSLNGRTLAALALRKLLLKITGRANR